MKVWYTKGLSNTADAMRILRRAYGEDITLVGSHSSPESPVRGMADIFLQEPPTTTNYAEWVMEQASENDIDLIIVQRGLKQLWPERDAFEAAGIRLHMTASPEVSKLLDRKDLFGLKLERLDIPTPAFEAFRTLEEFDEAAEILREDGSAPDGLCIKPVTGIFGSGFRQLVEDVREEDLILGNRFYEMGLEQLRGMLSRAPFSQDMMVMRYLPGVERSVDFLARDGRLITGISRVKHDGFQLLEADGAALDYAEALAEEFGLNGICNMQTREDAQGRQFVLEINPRMSGGMQMSCLGGVLLPAWDVALALNLRPVEQIPQVADGTVVRLQEVPVAA